MADYPFLSSLLPELSMTQKPELSYRQLRKFLESNLSKRDLRQLMVLRTYYDLENYRHFLKDEEFNRFGNYNEVELEDALLTGIGLPEYVHDFRDRYSSKEERLESFSQLFSTYFLREISESKGFLKQYLAFERSWRLVFLGFRAKKAGRDLVRELRYEDPNDPLVMQILIQKDAKNFEPPSDFYELKELFEEFGSRPLELQKALCEYRFAKIKEMIGTELLSMDRILAYTAMLITVEEWLELDQEKGKRGINQMIGRITQEENAI